MKYLCFLLVVPILAGCSEASSSPPLPRTSCITYGAPVHVGRGGNEYPTCHTWGTACPAPFVLREELVPAPGFYVNIPSEERRRVVQIVCRLPN